jgi:hypothetical protein
VARSSSTSLVVIECRAAPEALDRWEVPDGLRSIRLRPDRILAVGLGQADPAAWVGSDDLVVVADVSPGWTAFVVPNERAGRIWGMCSMPPGENGHAQTGLLAGVPAILVPGDEELTVLVGASYGRHVAAEIGSDVVRPTRSEAKA